MPTTCRCAHALTPWTCTRSDLLTCSPPLTRPSHTITPPHACPHAHQRSFLTRTPTRAPTYACPHATPTPPCSQPIQALSHTCTHNCPHTPVLTLRTRSPAHTQFSHYPHMCTRSHRCSHTPTPTPAHQCSPLTSACPHVNAHICAHIPFTRAHALLTTACQRSHLSHLHTMHANAPHTHIHTGSCSRTSTHAFVYAGDTAESTEPSQYKRTHETRPRGFHDCPEKHSRHNRGTNVLTLGQRICDMSNIAVAQFPRTAARNSQDGVTASR